MASETIIMTKTTTEFLLLISTKEKALAKVFVIKNKTIAAIRFKIVKIDSGKFDKNDFL